MTTPAATTPRNRYNSRDALGRFVKTAFIDEVEVWVNDENGVAHAHDRCGSRKGAAFTTGPVAVGWACVSCVKVETPAWIMALRTPPVGGTKCCNGCHADKSQRAFPTFTEGGIVFRGDTCRACQKASRSAAVAA